MLNLEMYSLFIITDSSGIQVETTMLGITCLTVMDYPVWHITHEEGTNTLVGGNCQKLLQETDKILDSHSSITNHGSLSYPELWDGKTAERTIEIISTDSVL